MAATTKHDLRERFAARRQALDERTRAAAEKAIVAHALSLVPATAAVIGSYAALPEEVATDALHIALRSRGHRICYPRVASGNDPLQWVPVDDLGCLRTGAFGVKEPQGHETAEPLTLMLVPGLAFDRAGYRLGYGGGYFDRTLDHRRPPRVVGICFGVQLADTLPHDPHDQRMDAVITEGGVVICSPAHSGR